MPGNFLADMEKRENKKTLKHLNFSNSSRDSYNEFLVTSASGSTAIETGQSAREIAVKLARVAKQKDR